MLIIWFIILLAAAIAVDLIFFAFTFGDVIIGAILFGLIVKAILDK